MTPAEEDRLLLTAIEHAMDVREDLAAAHRRVRAMGKFELEQLCCALAAMVDPNTPIPVMAWWRVFAPTSAEAAARGLSTGLSTAVEADRRGGGQDSLGAPRPAVGAETTSGVLLGEEDA